MAIKNIIVRGFGFNPGSVAFIPTQGYGSPGFGAQFGAWIVTARRSGIRALLFIWPLAKGIFFYGT